MRNPLTSPAAQKAADLSTRFSRSSLESARAAQAAPCDAVRDLSRAEAYSFRHAAIAVAVEFGLASWTNLRPAA